MGFVSKSFIRRLLSLLTLICYACCFLFISGPRQLAHAQPQVNWPNGGDHIFHHFGTDKGLLNPIVTAMTEDADGMLWVGTQGGLARWDGYRFKNFRPDPQVPGKLPDVFVQALHTDTRGQVWIGTGSAGLARYVHEEDKFIRYPVGAQGLSHVSVTAIIGDGEGGLWIGTADGVNHFDIASGKFRQFRQQTGSKLPDNHVRSLLRLRDGTLLIGTAKGLVRSQPRSSKDALDLEVVHIPFAQGKPAAVQTMLEASDGVIWLGTVQQGIFLLKKDRVESLAHSVPLASSMANDHIMSIVQVEDQKFWLGTYGQGIVVVDIKARSVQRHKRDPLQPRSLVDNTIWCLLRGKGGFLWVGNQRGLQMHDIGQQAVLSLFGFQHRSNGLTDPDIFSVLALKDGSVWLGLGNNGIDIIAPNGTQVRGLRPKPGSSNHTLPMMRVLGMAQDADFVYVASALGLYRVTQSNLAVQKFATTPENPIIDARALLVHDNKLWHAGDQSGLWWRNLPSNPDTPPQRPLGLSKLSDQRILVLEPGPEGKIWVGTRNGLNLFDPKTGEVEQILANPSVSTALGANFILSLHTDREGRLWVGTLGGGISILQKRDAQGKPIFQQVGKAQGLRHPNVSKILQDQTGLVWASTDEGMARIDPRTLKVESLVAAEGVPITEYWSNSGAKLASGELVFGGAGGLTIVRPHLFKSWRYQPPLVLTEINVMGKPIPSAHFNPSYQSQRGHVQATPLVLQSGSHHLAVEFAALDFSAPERLNYRYRLQGIDRDWLEVDANHRTAAYNNLPPGKYQLHLRGSNRAGNFPEKDLILPIEVVPAWYETWWFHMTGVLLLLLVIFFLLRLSTHFLRLRQRELESQVLQRTAQLEDKQQQLLTAIGGLNRANQNLALSADTLRHLGDVGRDITANLEAERVFEALHRHIGHLLDASTLVIYRYREQNLVRCFGREDGEALPIIDVALDSPTSHTARAARERQEILLEREPGQGKAQRGGKRLMLTSLLVPLIIDTKLLGVMAIQSERQYAYGERERMIFRTLCGYGAIALANAEVLSALHAAQHQLVQQEKLASLGGLVTGVAHEINTPLGVTILALSGVKEALRKLAPRLPTPDQLAPQAEAVNTELNDALDDGISYTEMALHNANRAAALITSFQAITAHFETDTLEELELATYLPEVAALFQTEFVNQGHPIEVLAHANLQIQTIAAALTEALSRILSNVQDHAYSHGRVGKVRLFAQQANEDCIEICVQDDGDGIQAAALPKVFDPFFSGANASSGHVGLGLHVAYNHVVLRLKGRITITSTPQQGTTVTIRLPRKYPAN